MATTDTTPAVRDVRLEQLQRGDWAAAAGAPWDDVDRLLEHLTTQTNIIDAARQIRWPLVLPRAAATVVDLGCGSGWLSGMLAAEPLVGRVIAWDGSPHLLGEVLPAMVQRMGGELAKVERVCGTFTPLLLEAGSVDAVAMSSAFHHAEDPDELLAELRRVLAPDGVLVLLNETPWHPIAMLAFAGRHFLSTALGLVGLPGPVAPGALTADGALYDDVLGDRAYTLRRWRRIAARNGFRLEPVRTGLMSYPVHQRPAHRLESELVHFVLRRRG